MWERELSGVKSAQKWSCAPKRRRARNTVSQRVEGL
jgi:hypothetical protein